MAIAVRSVYQPVVNLETRAVVGFEALARGPKGSAWESPDALFYAARINGTVAELDWACRLSALKGALAVDLPRSVHLFVNMEPGAMDAPPPQEGLSVLADAAALSVVIEVTERDLLADPPALLRAVEGVRERGWLLAVDDVGADTASLALLPFLRPDIIKLDMLFTQHRATEDTARVLAAVAAESDRTGAAVLAEGIETEEHLHLARELGAVLGQGWLFGAPGDLPRVDSPASVARLDQAAADSPITTAVTLPSTTATTPVQVMRTIGGLRRAQETLVFTIARQLERNAHAMGPSTIALSTVPWSTVLDAGSVERARSMAATGALVAIFGRNASAACTPDLPNLRGMDLTPDDPLADELSIVVVSPQFTAALVAQEVGSGPDGVRRYDYRLTYDRETVLGAARILLNRTSPATVRRNSIGRVRPA